MKLTAAPAEVEYVHEAENREEEQSDGWVREHCER